MDEKFLRAIKAYINVVEKACDLLITYIEQEEQIEILNKYDLYDYLHKNHKFEINIGKRKYYFHGTGCTVYLNNIPVIDWDFGYRSWWCGIEPYKMSSTLKHLLFEDINYYNSNFIKNNCEQYLLEKKIYYYKNQYYINMLKMGCENISFPINYDKVVIEFKGLSKTFVKCKNIDKFIRKSNSIYKGIFKLKNNYILVFYNNDIELARIPYNDIAYPDSAVKIMNEEIIKPHITEIWKK